MPAVWGQYEGNYKENKFHGRGVYVTRRGRYEGYFEDGLKHGGWRLPFMTLRPPCCPPCRAPLPASAGPQGALRFLPPLPESLSHSPTHTRTSPTSPLWAGRGVMEWFSGGLYVGMWAKGLMEGNGKFTSIDGKVYEVRPRSPARP